MREHELQKSIIQECNLRAKRNPLYSRIFAVPNGGHRDVRVARKLKAEGVKPGVLDLFLLAPCRGYTGLAMELKVGRNHPTAAQLDWIAWLQSQGYFVRVVHDDPVEAIRIIEWFIGDTE